MKLRNQIRRTTAYVLGAPFKVHPLVSKDLPFLYINNPKSGCSTVKHKMKEAQAAIFEERLEAFDRRTSPHVADDCLGPCVEFKECQSNLIVSCVRNPYSRILSGFLDKFKESGKSLKAPFQTIPETFEEFLVVLEDAAKRQILIDAHFRPQYENLGLSSIDYDIIFFLENFGVFEDFMHQSYGVDAGRFAPHARSASSRYKKFYNERTAELVREIYSEDFDAFGYSYDLSDISEPPAAAIIANKLADESDVDCFLNKPSTTVDQRQSIQSICNYNWLVAHKLI